MRIALAQINTTIGDFEGNFQRIIHVYEKAKKQKADLVIFPEMTLTGYPPKDLLNRPDFVDFSLKIFKRLVKYVTHPGCIIGFIDRRLEATGKRLYNAGALLHQKKIIGVKHKQLLPTYDVFDEGRYFAQGQSSPVFEFMEKKIGLSICEDIWTDPHYLGEGLYDTEPVKEQVAAGAELLINISASPFAMKKTQNKIRELSKQVKSYGCPLIYLNLVGANDDLVFDGRSLLFNQKGILLDQLKAFEEDFKIVSFNSLTQTKKSAAKSFRENEEKNALEALVLGLKDYTRKCGFTQAVLGLSGGIDSALTAWLAVQALGKENVLGVSMPSPFSSPSSYQDAQDLALALEIEFRVLPIHDLFRSYLETLGYSDCSNIDVTLQNIQARIRGNLLMAYSNAESRILLSTGNKSELSLGYCTLYGDMAGGFAVLADVPKTLVYRLANLANKLKRAIPLSSIKKAPSAELAPNQFDQDELPPYEVLDPILAHYIEENLTPEQIVAKGYDKKLVSFILKKLDNNEFKRSQLPPGIRISSRAFGHGRRIPLSSHFHQYFKS